MLTTRFNTSDVIIGTLTAAFCSRTQPDKRTIWSGDVHPGALGAYDSACTDLSLSLTARQPSAGNVS